ncbi:MAG: phosphoribosylglycinamide formyltransferase [Dokdonella sp.]|uniref:phosphoribosylglycinamide formyltransferase n=1 Tax=Dokdonella sp. TaxID=2291710 RepID=UPI002C8B12B5|nr:phosphoribosylglycinamide formyltransferase [Xanthomonadales bacterium]HQV72670.1 phosphoribosylglycinamide formyltransferase [Dokdonella sp.]MBK7209417.1 phosphoribosylglycinamide formyltransferase [Xanthomonadales bacterium]MBL0223371.1 phosphoribosylglycinamide formyltransferase [Xanthomonadales bacterium]HQW75450.1 phosphoribosylglycinamide formyltransferase [Dokdonella sp.]
MNDPDKAMRVVVLASGRGSNLEALIDAQRGGHLPIRIVGVLSDKHEARALELARSHDIAAIHLDPRQFPDRRGYDLALFARIADLHADLIVLAGFMRILDAEAFAPWLGRIINIHPSLLPRYPGLHTHRRALEAGDREHGASVHFVTAELDGGPVIAQTVIEIAEGDTEGSLASRLLAREHRLLVACVGLLAAGRLALRADTILLDGVALAAPLRLPD